MKLLWVFHPLQETLGSTALRFTIAISRAANACHAFDQEPLCSIGELYFILPTLQRTDICQAFDRLTVYSLDSFAL